MPSRASGLGGGYSDAGGYALDLARHRPLGADRGSSVTHRSESGSRGCRCPSATFSTHTWRWSSTKLVHARHMSTEYHLAMGCQP